MPGEEPCGDVPPSSDHPLARHRPLRCSPVRKFLEGKDYILITGVIISYHVRAETDLRQLPALGCSLKINKSVSFWCQLGSFSDGCLKSLGSVGELSDQQLAILTTRLEGGAGTLHDTQQHFARISQSTLVAPAPLTGEERTPLPPVRVPSHTPVCPCSPAATAYQAQGFVPMTQGSIPGMGGGKNDIFGFTNL